MALELPDGIRINKYMSDAGICSRREADRLVEEGKVLIDGRVAEVGARVFPGQKVTVAGREALATRSEDKVILAYNKPKGVECTSDRTNPDNIIDKIGYSKRVYTIGRLDKSSCGLILLTNDGDMAYRISKAGDNHEKEYIVRVDRPFPDEFLVKMAAGVPLEEKMTAPCKVERLGPQMFRIVLIQGLNRQIRRMCEYFDFKVVYLKRVRVMNILLGDLEPGTYREITKKEQDVLRALLDGRRPGSKRTIAPPPARPTRPERPIAPSGPRPERPSAPSGPRPGAPRRPGEGDRPRTGVRRY